MIVPLLVSSATTSRSSLYKNLMRRPFSSIIRVSGGSFKSFLSNLVAVSIVSIFLREPSLLIGYIVIHRNVDMGRNRKFDPVHFYYPQMQSNIKNRINTYLFPLCIQLLYILLQRLSPFPLHILLMRSPSNLTPPYNPKGFF